MSTGSDGHLPRRRSWRRVLDRFWTLGQVTLYTTASLAQSLVGAVAKALLARTLTVAAFGAFSFALSLLQFVGLFFEFGLFLPASRMAARSRGRDQREVLGAALVVFGLIALAFDLSVFGMSFFVDGLFHVDSAAMLRVVAPLAFVYPFALVGLQLAQGVDRLHIYSVTSTLGQAAFIGALLALVAIEPHPAPASVLLIRSAALGAGWVVLVVWLRPLWGGIRARTRALVGQAREYGFEVYLGRVLSIGTYNLDVIMLGALSDARSVGLYTLAGAVAAALGLPATGLAAALFPRMARSARIERRWLVVTWAVGLAGAAVGWLLAGPFFTVVFPSSYHNATSYVVPLALAQAIRGVTGIYNSHLSAHALGRALRNAGIVLTVSNIVFNFGLIPPFGAAGAAWASVLALAANLAAHVVGYRRSLSGSREEPGASGAPMQP